MGLFSKKKKKVDGQPAQSEEAKVSRQVLSEEYRKRLEEAGLAQFKRVIEAGSNEYHRDIDDMVNRLASDMREYTAKQLDITIARINQEITNQLNERISQYTKISEESQSLANQSLSRNAQLMYDKYQQMVTNLQQVVASQEVMMVSVFQDNRNNVADIQKQQSQLLQSLSSEVTLSIDQSRGLRDEMKQSVSQSAEQLLEVYQENIARLEKVRNAQDIAIDKLNQSVANLERQHEQLSELLNSSISQQKAMIAETINENMARIIEHYLFSALGDEPDISSQVPSIIRRMEENKQAMVDDMKL